MWRKALYPSSQDNDYVGLSVASGRVIVGGNRLTYTDDCREESTRTSSKLWAFTSATGAPQWTVAVNNGGGIGIQSIAVSGSRIVVAAAGVSARNVTNGSTIWSSTKHEGTSRVLVVGGVVPLLRVNAASEWFLDGLSVSDGHIVWTRPGAHPLAGDTDASTGTDLYVVPIATGGVAALNPLTGGVRWANADLWGDVLAVGKKRLIARCTATTLCALSRTDGSQLWTSNATSFSEATIAADLVYPYGSPSPLLASTGAPVSAPGSYPSGAYTLIVAGGRLISTQDRAIKVFAVG